MSTRLTLSDFFSNFSNFQAFAQLHMKDQTEWCYLLYLLDEIKLKSL